MLGYTISYRGLERDRETSWNDARRNLFKHFSFLPIKDSTGLIKKPCIREKQSLLKHWQSVFHSISAMIKATVARLVTVCQRLNKNGDVVPRDRSLIQVHISQSLTGPSSTHTESRESVAEHGMKTKRVSKEDNQYSAGQR